MEHRQGRTSEPDSSEPSETSDSDDVSGPFLEDVTHGPTSEAIPKHPRIVIVTDRGLSFLFYVCHCRISCLIASLVREDQIFVCPWALVTF